MDFDGSSVKYSEIKQDADLAELYSTLYTIPRNERVKVLMSWLVNAYSDLLIAHLDEADVVSTFTVHVRLLDTFANNSSYELVAQLASEFSDKFLKSQVIPNLLENYERTADVTFYFQTICEHLTCPSLIRKVMDAVSNDLTPIIIGRMLSDDQSVLVSTLSLIKSLLELYCEDLWYELILQYLLPMKHLLTSQRQKMLPEIEFQESTHKLLELIPKHVTDTIKPELLAEHFLLYFQDEIQRLRVIDSAVAASPPSSRSELQKVGLGLSKDFEIDLVEGEDPLLNDGKKTGGNLTYPMWIFRYDGTDFLHALRRGILQEPEEFFEDDLFSVSNQLNVSTLSSDGGFGRENDSGLGLPLSRSEISNDEDNFALASVSAPKNFDGDFNDSPPVNQKSFEKEEERKSESNCSSTSSPQDKSLNASIVKDKRKSFDLEVYDAYHNAYFGPFLNALYEILRRWTQLDPTVLFSATEIISVLASSRIPLINTLFLDMSLTLQPSFPSFFGLIHGIRNELDEKMKTYPDYIFRNVWRAAAKECSIPELSIIRNDREYDSDEEGNENSGFFTALRRSIGSNKSLRLAAGEVQSAVKIGRKATTFKALSEIFKSPTNSPGTSSEFRLLNRAAGRFEDAEEENCAKTMALRSVLFTHWMLELGAIAMQLSWGRRSFCCDEDPNIPNLDLESQAREMNREEVNEN